MPPLSTEPNRCERAYVGNTIGQANGVYDKPLDLRFCDYTNEKTNLKGKSLAAALMSDAKFDGADMSEVVMSKAYAVGASFKGNALYFVITCRFPFLCDAILDSRTRQRSQLTLLKSVMKFTISNRVLGDRPKTSICSDKVQYRLISYAYHMSAMVGKSHGF